MAYENIVLKILGATGLITLNRPTALNALCAALIEELEEAIDQLDADENIGAIIVTGSDKAFCAGADFLEMAPKSYADVYGENFITNGWERLTACRTPTIAAVAGYALGAGCELAMMCDIIIAADTARFGQPEISIGTIPGIGGTQRLTRAIGKTKAMEMCLTGRMMEAKEAERSGLVSRVVPAVELLNEAMGTAKQIAAMSRPAAMTVKEAINRSFETSMTEGIRFERRLFHSTFATEDQKESMSAFVEKRPPKFKNQ
jgi:enoyl-CoA hydratase